MLTSASSSPKDPWLKRFLFGLLLLLLGAPAIQAAWPLVAVVPLDGYTDSVPRPKFGWDSLRANAYQPALERKVEADLGFRPWFVRWRNQVAYWLFEQTQGGGIYFGKDRVLFQQGPIDAYLGRRFLGDEEINHRLKRLRRVQDSLRAHGTQLLFVVAPGKARVLPEMLPDSCVIGWQTRSNYSAAVEKMRQLGINLLDTTPLFLRWKD
ncbi:MAG: hypothetical protein H7Z21_12935, partial [Hymenobacter sp.]|nr:hypothetical protein [Hymenobacter sp.]